MDVLTGPQGSKTQRGALCEAAGLRGLVPALSVDVAGWLAVTTLYLMIGWELCPDAVADVQMAIGFGVTVSDIPIS